jgi:hypothetical protein
MSPGSFDRKMAGNKTLAEETHVAEYAIMLFTPTPFDPDAVSPENRAEHERHGAEISDLGGKVLAAFELAAGDTATSIRGDVLTDGPFIESKEIVAGFYVIEAPDLDTALAIAKRNPVTWQGGGVEVRPVHGYVIPN